MNFSAAFFIIMKHRKTMKFFLRFNLHFSLLGFYMLILI